MSISTLEYQSLENTIFSMNYPEDKSTKYLKIIGFILLATIFILAVYFGKNSNSFTSHIFIFIFGMAFLIVIYENILMLSMLDEVVLTNHSIVIKKAQRIKQTIAYKNIGYKTDIDIRGKTKIYFYDKLTNKNIFIFKETDVSEEKYKLFINILSKNVNLDENQLTSTTYGQMLPLVTDSDIQSASDGESIYYYKKAFFESYNWIVYILVGVLMFFSLRYFK